MKGWWETAAHRIRAALQEQVTTYCRDVVVLQQLRDFVFLFTRTISAYGYDVTLMQDFFKNMRDKYIDLATQSYREEFLTVCASFPPPPRHLGGFVLTTRHTHAHTTRHDTRRR